MPEIPPVISPIALYGDIFKAADVEAFVEEAKLPSAKGVSFDHIAERLNASAHDFIVMQKQDTAPGAMKAWAAAAESRARRLLEILDDGAPDPAFRVASAMRRRPMVYIDSGIEVPTYENIEAVTDALRLLARQFEAAALAAGEAETGEKKPPLAEMRFWFALGNIFEATFDRPAALSTDEKSRTRTGPAFRFFAAAVQHLIRNAPASEVAGLTDRLDQMGRPERIAEALRGPARGEPFRERAGVSRKKSHPPIST